MSENNNLPAVAGQVQGWTPIPVDKITSYFEYVDQIRSGIMKDKVDYDTIPGTKKPTLLKPGAEKLGFAFQLAATNSILDAVEDHTRNWEYVIPILEWNGEKKRKEKVGEERNIATGFYFYKVRCVLSNKVTGELVADQIGTCCSSERGRETAPANTIIKIAQKRAYVGAILQATFSSDRFTQDLDDTPDAGDAANKEAGSTPPPGCARIMESRYDDASFCYTCKKNHVQKGDLIVQDAETSKWHSLECWTKKHPAEKPSEKPADPPAEPTEDPTPKNGTYLEQAKRGEDAYCALFEADEQPAVEAEIVEARLSFLKAKLGGEPTSNLELASPGTMKGYVKWLADSVRNKRGETSV